MKWNHCTKICVAVKVVSFPKGTTTQRIYCLPLKTAVAGLVPALWSQQYKRSATLCFQQRWCIMVGENEVRSRHWLDRKTRRIWHENKCRKQKLKIARNNVELVGQFQFVDQEQCGPVACRPYWITFPALLTDRWPLCLSTSCHHHLQSKWRWAQEVYTIRPSQLPVCQGPCLPLILLSASFSMSRWSDGATLWGLECLGSGHPYPSGQDSCWRFSCRLNQGELVWLAEEIKQPFAIWNKEEPQMILLPLGIQQDRRGERGEDRTDPAASRSAAHGASPRRCSRRSGRPRRTWGPHRCTCCCRTWSASRSCRSWRNLKAERQLNVSPL